MSNFAYYRIEFKLLSCMLGTGTQASIWNQHVQEKAKKEIAKLNKTTKRLSAASLKYGGTEISADKEIEEIKGCIRATEEVLGKKGDLPVTMPDLLAYANELAVEFAESIKAGEAMKATVFMRNADGFPVISTHMILGNLKENLKIMVNNSKGEKIYKSKAGVGEVLALDVKAVDEFMVPSMNVVRGEDGKPVYLERPIRFQDGFGGQMTAISMSEQLPVGTEFQTVLRVRAGSLIEDMLPLLLDMGKSNGLGAWRGSGGKGSYCYKLKELKDYEEKLPDGWK